VRPRSPGGCSRSSRTGGPLPGHDPQRHRPRQAPVHAARASRTPTSSTLVPELAHWETLLDESNEWYGFNIFEAADIGAILPDAAGLAALAATCGAVESLDGVGS
jgi:hypothetical protein